MNISLNTPSIFNGKTVKRHKHNGTQPSMDPINANIVNNLISVFEMTNEIPDIVDVALYMDKIYLRFANQHSSEKYGVELYFKKGDYSNFYVKTVGGKGDSTKNEDAVNGFSKYLYESLKGKIEGLEYASKIKCGLKVPYNPNNVNVETIINVIKTGSDIFTELLQNKLEQVQ